MYIIIMHVILYNLNVVLYFIPGYMIGIMIVHCFCFNAPLLFILFVFVFVQYGDDKSDIGPFCNQQTIHRGI